MTSTDQPTLKNHEETKTSTGQPARRGRGAALSSSRYGYRRFRNFQNSARGQPRGSRNVPSEETAMRDVVSRPETLATVPDSGELFASLRFSALAI
ncbi:unnamed protein product [Gongylonema pulchrum]|uniref:FMRFamide neuropeptide n=1 Tax=Gongylonema pulchrum TaxID=637853 RepID=A0A183E3Y7_9BILA|nr:unnamed protein product [Gongylonema pulchrum]